MLEPEPTWRTCIESRRPIGGVDTKLFTKYALGTFEDSLFSTVWFCIDRMDGAITWRRRKYGRPNLIVGLEGDMIIATELREGDGPWSDVFGIYGMSFDDQKLKWTAHARSIWKYPVRLLDFVPRFTNELRDAPLRVQNGEIVSRSGAVINAATGALIRRQSREETIQLIKAPDPDPNWQLFHLKQLDCGVNGVLHRGTPDDPEKPLTIRQNAQIRLYMTDSTGRVKWTFDVTQFGEICNCDEMTYVEPFIYLSVSDAPLYAPYVKGEPSSLSPALFSLWTLDTRSGEIVQKVRINEVRAIGGRIAGSDRRSLLYEFRQADLKKVTLLNFKIAAPDQQGRSSSLLKEDSRLRPGDSTTPDWLVRLDFSGFHLVLRATEDQIRAAEATMGFPMPPDYREFLKVSNGAVFGDVVLNPFDLTSKSVGEGVLKLWRLTSDPHEWPVLKIGHMRFGSADEVVGFRKVDLAKRRVPCPLVVFWHESGEVDELEPTFQEFLTELVKLGPGAEYVPRWSRHAPSGPGSPRFPALLFNERATHWQRSLIPVPELRALSGHGDPQGWAASPMYHLVDSDRRVFSISYAENQYSLSDTSDRLSDSQLINLMTGNLRALRKSPDEFLETAGSATGDKLFRMIYERTLDLPQMSTALHVAGCVFILVLGVAAFAVPIAISWWFFMR